jgi:hypothetical protein
MRVIIAGTRTFDDLILLEKAIEESGFDVTTEVCGMAAGADTLGKFWALARDIPVDEHVALWNVYGKSAGYKRNAIMAEHADALIALWDGKSRGTKHMIDIATAKGLKVFVKLYQA